MKKMVALLLVLCTVCAIAVPAFAESLTAQQEFSTKAEKNEVIFQVTEKTGTWNTSTAVKGYKSDTHEYCAMSVQATATFGITGIKSGNYELYYWVMPHSNNASKIKCTLTHNGKETPVMVHQILDEGEKVEPGWVSMGVYDFSGDGSEKLYYQNPSDGPTRISAIRLVPTKKELTKVEEKPVEPEQSSPGASTVQDVITVAPSGLCTYVGNWSWSTAVKGPMEQAESSLWIAGEDKKDAYVKYDPQISASGNVRISVYLLHWKENQTTNVKYEVHHNGKVDEFHIDMTKLTKNEWRELGIFDFSGKGDEFVKLIPTDAGHEKTNTRASTVAFEIINDAQSNSVWQTKYVTPNTESQNASLLLTMASLDKFADMKDHWASYDVEFMANEGFVQGTGEGAFSPDSTITRAEFVTILDRALGFELKSEDAFADVPETEWFYPYVATAKINGLLEGLPITDTFEPNKNITREEMAQIIYNAILQQKKNDEWVESLPEIYNNYQDKNSVSSWAQTALQYLNRVGLIQGTSDITISPQETATRAQAAVILKRFMQQFVWAGPPADEEWVLTFNDEFLGDSVNWDVWVSDASSPGHIQSSRWPENAEVHDGALYLINRKEERGGKSWTSGNIWVNPTVFRQSYGYWEARYKIAAGYGVNNSFWAITRSNMYTMANQAFEIDINEGHYPNEVCTTLHSSHQGKSQSYSQSYRSAYDLSADYHTYALKWDPDYLYYYHDGKLLFKQETLNAHIPLYPYLSSAILNWAGTADDQTDGTAQIVDYVRIWQRPADAKDETKTLFNQPVVPVSGTASLLNGVKPVFIEEQKIDNAMQKGEIILMPETKGTWVESSAVPSYDGKPHLWSNKDGDSLTYYLKNVPKGKYKAYIWRMPHKNNVWQMDYEITQNGEKSYFGSVAMGLAEGQTAESGWVLVNEGFDLTDTNGIIFHQNPASTIRALPIKLVPIK